MSDSQPNNPLHGIKLEQVVTQLQAHYGWDGLAERVNINCFKTDPSVKSSLKFLRRTLWAREKVEALYITTFTCPPRNKGIAPSPVDPWANSRKKTPDFTTP
jgi:uncharacterized protein (DUF2132 family)